MLTAAGPCDYTGLTYDKLRGGSGIPWPVQRASTRTAPTGSTPTASSPPTPDYCETYGHDLLTGATVDRAGATGPWRPAAGPSSRRAPYHPPHEEPDDDYPLRYTTGRTVYQFHTRTKTGRARPLNDAAPDAWVEISPGRRATGSASPRATWSGSSRRRGAIEVPARVGDVRPGAVFAPFHYGYWDAGGATRDCIRRPPTS